MKSKGLKSSSVAMLSVMLLASACRGNLEEAASFDTSASATAVATTNVGTPQTDGFWVHPYWDASSSTDKAYSYYLHDQSSAFSSKECRVVSGDATTDIYCLLDVNELDLYFNGVKLQFNSPPSMCDYTSVYLYSFYGLEAGTVSGTNIQVYENADGSLEAAHAGGAIQNLPANASLDAPYTSPTCDFDYTSSEGPNCCEGKWSVTVTKAADTSVTPNVPGSTSTVTGDFGGKISNCIRGPGKDFAVNKSGYPTETYFRTLSQGQNQVFTVKAPIADHYSSVLYAANYWDPADFGAGASTFPPAGGTANWPVAAYFPYYEFRCMDVAEDTIARIRILVRAWDTLSEFDAQNNPYTSPSNTTEPGYNNDYLLHDRSVWKDVLTYPTSFDY